MTPDNIRRLIQNQKSEHSPHAFRGSGGGMKDFNLLYPAFAELEEVELRKWMELIDAMRATHSECESCTAKILAYSILFTEKSCPALSKKYQELYTDFMAGNFVRQEQRDIMEEVRASLRETKDP